MLTRARKGFTLLELIVVLVILGLLAAIAIPTYQAVIGSAEKTQAEETAKALARNIQAVASLERVAPGDAAFNLDTSDPDLEADAIDVAMAELTAPSGVVVTKVSDTSVTVAANNKVATITVPATYSGSFTVATV